MAAVFFAAVVLALLAFFAVVADFFDAVLLAAVVFAAAVVFFAAGALPFAAVSSEDCVTPVVFAISLRIACVSSVSPRSALPSSAADRPLIFLASCSCVRPAPVRASLISVPTLFAMISYPFVLISPLFLK